MKRVFALLLTVLLLAQLIVPTFAYATNGTLVLVLSADKTTVQRGESVTVSVSITENPGWYIFGAVPDFNKTKFTQSGSVTYGEIGSGTKGKTASIDAGDEDTTETGFLFSYTIVANGTATLGNYTLGLKQFDACNMYEEELEVSCNTVTVQVIDCPHDGAFTEHPAVASTSATPGHAAYVTCDLCGAVISGDPSPLPLDPSNPESDSSLSLVLTADKTTVQRGDTVTISVSITENPGFMMFGAKADFDKTNFTQSGNVTYGEIGSGTKGKNANIDAGDEDTTETGFLFSYTVTVNDTATLGNYTLGLKSIDAVSLINVVNGAYHEFTADEIVANTVTVQVVDCMHDGAFTEYPAVASTCVTPGHAAYVTCDLCGFVIEGDATPLPLDLTNHEGEPVVVPAVTATCTVKGVTAGTKCSACDAILSGCEEGELDPTNHGSEDTALANGRAATCTEAGYTGDVVYACCGAFLEPGEVIPALGHNYLPAVTPPCTEAGYTTYTCSRCGDFYVADFTDPTGHAWGEPVYLWTRAENGDMICTATRTCSNDASHVESEALPGFGVQTKAPACTAPGETTYVVRFTNSAFPDQTHVEANIPATGHTWSGPVYTWAEDGSSCTASHTCSVCHETETEEGEIGGLGMDPTCTEDGYVQHGAFFRNECFEEQTWYKVIPALGHNYLPAVTPPSCTEAGYTTYTCSRCGDFYVADFTDPTGHAWGEPTYIFSDDGKTCTAACTCLNDASHVKTETVATLGTVTVPATCTEMGETTYRAVFTDPGFVCEETCVLQDIPALGHAWGEPAYGFSADGKTCTATRVCANDPSHVETETVATISLATKQATCTEAGETTYVVYSFTNPAFTGGQICVLADIPALGHTWDEVSYTWSADGKVCTATAVCTTCGEIGSETATAFVDIASVPVEEGGFDVLYYNTAAFEEAGFETQRFLFGDANGDGKVTNKDIVRLKKYFANFDDAAGHSTEEIFPGADANGDGEVNNKDIVRLKNYFANYNSVTGLSSVILGPSV